MGFKPKNKLYNLKFLDPDYEGLEVLMRPIPTGKLLEIQSLHAATQAAAKAGTTVAEDEGIREVVKALAESMVSWNLEDEFDQPVPATFDGLLSQDYETVMAVLNAWTEAVAGVAAPLEQGSTSGVNALEASIPMETLSMNLAS